MQTASAYGADRDLLVRFRAVVLGEANRYTGLVDWHHRDDLISVGQQEVLRGSHAGDVMDRPLVSIRVRRAMFDHLRGHLAWWGQRQFRSGGPFGPLVILDEPLRTGEATVLTVGASLADPAAQAPFRAVEGETYEPSEAEVRLCAALEALPAMQHNIVRRRHVEGQSFADIGRHYRRGDHYVREQYHAGLAALRDQLDPVPPTI